MNDIIPVEVTEVIEAYKSDEYIVNEDFDKTRENLYSLIEKGNTSLDELIQIASASQHPRSFEVLSLFMKTLIEANKEILELSKKKKDLIGEGEKKITNNLYLTTADLLKMIKQAKQDD